MTVDDVLGYLASGMSVDEVLADFPDLTIEDIEACRAFAVDRRKRHENADIGSEATDAA